jgi:hypothetical protein
MSARVPTDAKTRKGIPLARGLLDYFPDALLAVAELSRIGNEQHQPGEPMRWAKEKSTDEPDALMRHLIDRGTVDSDGVRHSTKVAWRALALLQREIDAEREQPPAPPPVRVESTYPAHVPYAGELEAHDRVLEAQERHIARVLREKREELDRLAGVCSVCGRADCGAPTDRDPGFNPAMG